MRTRTKFFLFIGAVLALLALPAIKVRAQVAGTTAFAGVPFTNGNNYSTNFVLPAQGTNATTTMQRVYNARFIGLSLSFATQPAVATNVTGYCNFFRSRDGVNCETNMFCSLQVTGGANGVLCDVYTNVDLGGYQYLCLGSYTNSGYGSNVSISLIVKPGF